MVPVVLKVETQQATGREYWAALAPARVYPLKVTPMPTPTFGSSKTALAPGPATRMTPVGAPEATVLLKAERVVAVVPSKTLSASGKTSMNWVNVAPLARAKLGR
jgi:hypothetical protein